MKGQKVEYYNGITLSPGSAEKAFRLPRAAPVKSFGDGYASSWGDRRSYGTSGQWGTWIWFIIIGIFFFAILMDHYTFSTTYEAPPVKHLLRLVAAVDGRLIRTLGREGFPHHRARLGRRRRGWLGL